MEIESSLFQGGPHETQIVHGSDPTIQEMSANTPTDQVANTGDTQATIPAAPKKYFVGSRVFETPDEAVAYANGLATAQTAQVTAPTPEEPKVRLGQLIFEDPDAALEQVISIAQNKVRSEIAEKENKENVWKDFYLRHPDLKGSEFLVESVLGRETQRGTFSNMNITQGTPILAQKAREEIQRIRNASSGGQALPSKPAMVAGSSGAPVPSMPTPKAQPTNMIAEMRAMRRRG